MTKALARWKAGATAADFTPAECAALGEYLMQRHEAYRNAKHPDHAGISREVSELMQRAHPGHVGADGSVCDGPAPAGLFGGA